MVSQSGWKLQPPVRIFQPESETGAGYPNRRRQPDRAGRARSGTADAFSYRAGKWGVFTVTVPKDFGSNQLTWTLTANGATTSVPASLNPLWELSPFRDATGNTPPFIGFASTGPFVQGPRGQSTSLTTTLPDPVTLNLWVADDASVIPGATRSITPAVTITLEQVPRTGLGVFREGRAGGGEGRIHGTAVDRVPGKGDHHRDIQRAGRIRAARTGERLVGRGRPRISVLLVQCGSEGHGEAVAMR